MFVAGFIGSPAMNFLNVVLKGEGDDLYVDGGTFKLHYPRKGQTKLEYRQYVGKEVIMGIRPEDIYDTELLQRSMSWSP